MATRKKAKGKSKSTAKRKKTSRKKLTARKKTTPAGKTRAKKAAVRGASSKKARLPAKPSGATSQPAARARPAGATPRPTAKPATAAPTAKPAAQSAAAEERIGVVTHYFGHLSVATLRLERGTLRVGDTIHIHGHTTDFTQKVESLEVDHASVNEVGPDDDFGLKVVDHAREHDVVYKVRT